MSQSYQAGPPTAGYPPTPYQGYGSPPSPPPAGYPYPGYGSAPAPQAPLAGQPYAPSPVQGSNNSKIVTIILGVALVLALIGNIALVATRPSPLPVVTVTVTVFPSSPNPDGVVTPTLDLQVGNCFGRQHLLDAGFEEVVVVPCDDLHDAEALFIGDMPRISESLPADPQWEDWATEHCDPAFKDYIGLTEVESEFSMRWVIPSEKAWAEGLSTMFCYIFADSDQIGSINGSNR